MLISTEGDIGDCIYLLSIIRQIPGGPHSLGIIKSDVTKARGDDGARKLHEAVAPLATLQPYIKEVTVLKTNQGVDWVSALFRRQHYNYGETLMQAHLNHLVATLKIGHGFTGSGRWINVASDPSANGRVVVNRTGRYRNSRFPWGKIVSHYRHRLLFVGMRHEWREFCGHYGYVEFRETPDMLGVASVIAGSDLFIGNQSCAYAVAEGMKHNSIQETSIVFPDCIYHRENAQFSIDGAVSLPDVSGSGVLDIPPERPNLSSISTMTTPPGEWQFPGIAPTMTFDLAVDLVRSLPDWGHRSAREIKDAILQFTVDRCPGFGGALVNRDRYDAALQTAKLRALIQTDA